MTMNTTNNDRSHAVAGPVDWPVMQHTPGRWVAGIGKVKNLDGEHLGVGLPQAGPGENWTPIALLSPAEHVNATDMANARLIAAAPALLAALRDLVDVMTGRMDGETVALHNALAALQSAAGAA